MKRKGNPLIQKRNETIVMRFNYWYNVQRLRLDDVIKRLSEDEFFLKEETIMAIIKRVTDMKEAKN